MIQLDNPSPIVQKPLLNLYHTGQKHWKDIESYYTPSKFESTLHTSNLDVKKFSNVTKRSNIQMKNPYPSEVGLMNTIFEENKNKKALK
jgi:hypothetical protein